MDITRNYLAFDIEICKPTEEVADWRSCDRWGSPTLLRLTNSVFFVLRWGHLRAHEDQNRLSQAIGLADE